MFKKFKLSGRPEKAEWSERVRSQETEGKILRVNVIDKINFAYENLKSQSWLTRRLVNNFNEKYFSPYEKINPKDPLIMF